MNTYGLDVSKNVLGYVEIEAENEDQALDLLNENINNIEWDEDDFYVHKDPSITLVE